MDDVRTEFVSSLPRCQTEVSYKKKSALYVVLTTILYFSNKSLSQLIIHGEWIVDEYNYYTIYPARWGKPSQATLEIFHFQFQHNDQTF